MAREEKPITKKRGRPATGLGQMIGVRLQPPSLDTLDAWIGSQPDPKPTRPEAIRRLLERALGDERPERTIEQKISSAKDRIARNPDKGEPSPEQGMATLRRGLAETKLRSLKARKRQSPRRNADDGR
jgi:hypothetical protein